MSKKKIKNTNQPTKVPIKVEPTKPQKAVVKKNINKSKLIESVKTESLLKSKTPIISKVQNTVISKGVTNKIKEKEIEKKKKNDKIVEKVDIESSCEDEDELEDDIEVIESDTDEFETDSSDNDEKDSDNSSDEDEDTEIFDIKVEQKKREPVTPNASKISQTKELKHEDIPKEIDLGSITDSGKILKEINNRKNLMSNCVVYISKLPKSMTRQNLLKILDEIAPVVSLNLPGKVKKEKLVNRGYGFIRYANEEDSSAVIKFLQENEINGTKILASKFVCKTVFSKFENVELKKIAVHSFKNEDITAQLTEHFKAPVTVTKVLTTQYTLDFPNEADAMTLFKKEKMTLKGRELFFNFVYSHKDKKKKKNKASDVPTKTESENPKLSGDAGAKVAVGKRPAEENDVDGGGTALKKTKLSNGTQVVTKKESVQTKVKQDTPKLADTKKTATKSKEVTSPKKKDVQNKSALKTGPKVTKLSDSKKPTLVATKKKTKK